MTSICFTSTPISSLVVLPGTHAEEAARAEFARDIVFAEFGRHGRTLDASSAWRGIIGTVGPVRLEVWCLDQAVFAYQTEKDSSGSAISTGYATAARDEGRIWRQRVPFSEPQTRPTGSRNSQNLEDGVPRSRDRKLPAARFAPYRALTYGPSRGAPRSSRTRARARHPGSRRHL